MQSHTPETAFIQICRDEEMNVISNLLQVEPVPLFPIIKIAVEANSVFVSSDFNQNSKWMISKFDNGIHS